MTKNKGRASWRCIVLIKPVPDPALFGKLRLDPDTMLLRRDEVPSVLDPLDRGAIEAALGLRRRHGGKVAVITMAPPSASEQLLEALALGCDRAFLLTDKAFAGADTLATARTLAAGVRKAGRFDLVLCGAWSADGSTAQVGPQLAELLGLPDLVCASGVELRGGKVRAQCLRERGTALLEASRPAVVTVHAGSDAPRLAPLGGLPAALRSKVTVWSARDLGLKPGQVGLAGSPTRMLNVFVPSAARKGELLQGTADEVASQLLDRLRHERLLPTTAKGGSR
ncbi:MAG: electron transfer flavoprotein subunit beta/FixA family protein [Elusimicrobia bacterium]|nr:electron transfer flavoprotein subunit beta/FixA family protein [Elusimicrobiota bacterium]